MKIRLSSRFGDGTTACVIRFQDFDFISIPGFSIPGFSIPGFGDSPLPVSKVNSCRPPQFTPSALSIQDVSSWFAPRLKASKEG
jgi:hypothetical protein